MTLLEENKKSFFVGSGRDLTETNSVDTSGPVSASPVSSGTTSSSPLASSRSRGSSGISSSASPPPLILIPDRSRNYFSAAAMLSANAAADRYIIPDFLAPPPSTDKNGKSPLQLLAQTCSQIGADTGSNKLLAEKSGGSCNSTEGLGIKPTSPSSINNNSIAGGMRSRNKASPPLNVSTFGEPRHGTSPSSIATTVNFKPYEIDESGPLIGSSSNNNNNNNNIHKKSTPSPTKTFPQPNVTTPKTGNNVKSSSPTEASSPSSASSSSTTNKSNDSSVALRNGMEMLFSAQQQKEATAGAVGPFPRSYPGTYMDNPAFRSSYGYPPTSVAASLSAAASGVNNVCRDPYCRDLTCPTALYNAHLASMGVGGLSGLTSGYMDLLKAHQMAAAVMAAANTSNSNTSSPTGSSGGSGAYICNWMNGREGYCGKRHSSAEELLQHLRTHTNLSTSDSAAALLSSSMYQSSHGLLAGASSSTTAAAAAAALHRSYGGAALAASRYHPYAKSGSSGLTANAASLSPALGALGASGLGGIASLPAPLSGHSANMNALAGLSAAYSPSSLYALYGSRLAGSLP